MTTKLTEEQEFEEMQKTMLLKVTSIPAVVSAAKKIFDKTMTWASENGIGVAASKKTTSAKAKAIGAYFDKEYSNHSGDMRDTMWATIKGLLEAVLEEPIPTKCLVKSKPKTVFIDGLAIKMIANKSDHNYPLNEVFFVTNGGNLRGTLQTGAESTTYFDPYADSIGLPTEAEILAALGALYVAYKPKFTQVSEL
jgi:hypothetical protein